MSQNLDSKASQGRFFPLSFAEAVAIVRERDFAVHSYYDRLPVRLQNCDVECDLGHQLCSFMRMSYLAVLSLPDSVHRATAKAAVILATSEFAALDKTPHLAVRDQQFVVYRAYLGALGRLTVTQHIVSAGSRSYLQFKGAATLSKAQRSPKQQSVLSERTAA